MNSDHAVDRQSCCGVGQGWRVLLLVSVAFNVFFAVGYLRARSATPVQPAISTQALAPTLKSASPVGTEPIEGSNSDQASAPRRWRFEERAKWIAENLDLSDDQKQQFDTLLAETLGRREQVRGKMRPWKEKLLAELVKDQPDEAVLQKFMEQDHFKVRRQIMIEQLRKLMAILTPQQRQKFMNLIAKQWSKP